MVVSFITYAALSHRLGFDVLAQVLNTNTE
jgi:hypothetical protein